MMTSILLPEQIKNMLEAVNLIFPNWQGFSDPRFEKEEVTYKQQASQKVKILLNESDVGFDPGGEFY